MKKVYFLLFFCSFPLKAAIIASGNDCGDNCHWEIDDQTKTLTVTGTGGIKNYNRACPENGCYTDAPWRAYSSQIEIIDIGEGLTSIGAHAFEDMERYREVNLPSTMEVIGAESLRSENLKTINLPDSVTTIGSWAFEGSGLVEFNIPPQVTRLEFAVLGNTNLSNIVIPDWVEYIDPNAFAASLEDDRIRTPLNTIYCPEALQEQCRVAAGYRGIEPTIYSKDANGNFIVGLKAYSNMTDILSGNYIKKRIYTIEEASRASKPTGNVIKLRYK